MTNSAMRLAARQIYALGIYRSLTTLALMVAGFSAFPYHRSFVGFAILAFNQGVSAVIVGQQAVAAHQNHLDDSGERKTRHAILLASEDWSGPSFWNEVDRSVEEERGVSPPASPWYSQIGLVFGNIL